ncbi:MAG: hypothetical protein ACI892_000445 [Marinobacter maritimus]|jgi:hypothetical protein
MSNSKTLQQEMQALRSKNEYFFSKKEPTIYNLIKDKKFTSSDLSIIKTDTLELELDVIEKGESRYFGAGMSYSQQEADKFLTQMHPGITLPKFLTTDSEIFSFDRVGSAHFRQLAETIGEKVDASGDIHLPEFYPMLVIMGVGLGIHLEKLVREKEISSLIIYEHKLDRFLTSLYTVDWENIYSYFNIDKGHSLQIIISSTDDMRINKGILWNEITCYCPHFPFTTLFYNHLNDKTNGKIIIEIKSDIITYLQQWGHYDDEINQYNNARQNLLQGAKTFNPSTFKVNPHIHVAVVGAGPSLDERIEILQKYRDKLLIISCGTTLGTLCKYNIKPDFHVELESDYVVYEALSKATTAEFRKGIKLLASAQVNPRCMELFEESCLYFKDSTALSELYIHNENDVIRHTTPTCTNAGIAIATKLGFRNIFLFGTDFGFVEKNKHHASGSIYYKDESDISFVLSGANDFKKEATIKTMGVHGQLIETKPMYYTAQRRVEECIKYCHRQNITIYNCSDGASIKNTQWISNKKLTSILEASKVAASPKELTEAIYNSCSAVPNEIIDEKSKILLALIDNVLTTLNKRKINNKKPISLFDISKNIFIQSNIISRHGTDRLGYIQYFIRGQIWIYLSIYYTYALSAKNQDELDFVVSTTESWLEEHQKILITEMKDILFHKRSLDNDRWINETVESEEFKKTS